MSYARFGWDDSDVYIFEHVDGGIECCGCALQPVSVQFVDLAALAVHLDDHEEAGHTVPAGVRTGIYADWRAGEYTAWDTTDPQDPAVHAWGQLTAPPEESMADYLERNRHMLGEQGPELIAKLREDGDQP